MDLYEYSDHLYLTTFLLVLLQKTAHALFLEIVVKMSQFHRPLSVWFSKLYHLQSSFTSKTTYYT